MRAALMDGSICAARSFPSGCNSIQHVKDRRKDGLLSCRCYMTVQSPSGSLLQRQCGYLRPATATTNYFNYAFILDSSCEGILMFLITLVCTLFVVLQPNNVSCTVCWL